MSIYIPGYLGFGDNLNQRPFVRHLLAKHDDVYLCTPAPQLYHDMGPGLHFVKPDTELRMQRRNIDAQTEALWEDRPEGADTRQWAHSGIDMRNGVSVPGKCAEAVGPSYDFSFCPKPKWVADAQGILDRLEVGERPICLVHLPTVRREFMCRSRNPRIEYFHDVINANRDEYVYIGIANEEPEQERIDGKAPELDAWISGESLTLETLCGLEWLASMVLCSPSFFLLLGIAVRAHTFCIFGGHIPPNILTDECQDLSRFGYAAPEPFCDCAPDWPNHTQCNKAIPCERLLSSFNELRERD